MRVALGKFARSALEDHLSGDLSAGVGAALRHYERRSRSPWPPLDVPDAVREGSRAERPAVVLEIPVEASVRAALEAEAERQGLSLDQVVTHAVFVYLADLDRPERGRSARRPAGG